MTHLADATKEQLEEAIRILTERLKITHSGMMKAMVERDLRVVRMELARIKGAENATDYRNT